MQTVLEGNARAHPNIALVKYWGKKPGPETLNVPATPSLSITLDSLWSKTRIRWCDDQPADRLSINGKSDPDQLARVSGCLNILRRRTGTTLFADVVSENNFPTGAGIASSASGFAALVTAASCSLGAAMTDSERSRLARRSSASAARSIYGGFVELGTGTDPAAQPVLGVADWPLRVLVIITSLSSKLIGSSAGMRRSAETSDYYDAWVRSAPDDFAYARRAVLERDFEGLADVSESSCLKMHSVMLSSKPALVYWNGTTVEIIHRIRELRGQGVPVFFTIDAGPQVKAVCLPGYQQQVEKAVTDLPGVIETIHCGLGPGAHEQQAA